MPNTKRVFTVSASSLGTIQSCETQYKYGHMMRLVPRTAERALDFGGLVHYMLRPYYFSTIPPEFRKGNHYKHVFEPLFRMNRGDVIQACVEIGRLKSLTSDLSADDRMAAIDAFIKYTDYYRGENLRAIEVEQPFSKLLYDDDELAILYEGIVDLIALLGNSPVPKVIDHKTGGRDRHMPETNNQINGTCWAFGVNQFVINKILQVKDTPYRRVDYYVGPEQKEDWVRDSIHYVKRMIHYIDSNYYPMNRNSCGSFGGCRYLRVCKVPYTARETMLEGLFKKSTHTGLYGKDTLLEKIASDVLGKYNVEETHP